jgi:hypothetical protein
MPIVPKAKRVCNGARDDAAGAVLDGTGFLQPTPQAAFFRK